MDIIYWLAGVEGIVILTSYKFHFTRVNENLMQDPSNSKSIHLLFTVKSGGCDLSAVLDVFSNIMDRNK